MKFTFKESDGKKVVGEIEKALGDRELAKLVSFDLKGSELVVTISKLGTSTLTFSQKPGNGGLTFELSNEKIAFAHRAFKDEVTKKIVSVIERAGGKLV